MKSTDLTREQVDHLLADVTPMLVCPIEWTSAARGPSRQTARA
jgi:hypothetical protein